MQTSPAPNFTLQVDRKSPHYPLCLNDLYDPPERLYIQGDIHLLKQPMIAIVGSRNASPEGIKNAGLFAQALSKAGALVVSGLAKGVDRVAHQAVIELEPNHCTAAILGTGIDVVYPRQNIELSHAISQQGLLASEPPRI